MAGLRHIKWVNAPVQGLCVLYSEMVVSCRKVATNKCTRSGRDSGKFITRDSLAGMV